MKSEGVQSTKLYRCGASRQLCKTESYTIMFYWNDRPQQPTSNLQGVKFLEVPIFWDVIFQEEKYQQIEIYFESAFYLFA